MGFYRPYVDPTFIFKRKGTEDDPFLFLQDTNYIKNSAFILKEIPKFEDRVKVTDSNNNELTEVKAEEIGVNEYRVDYTTGIIDFHENRNGEKVTCEYYGMGQVFISASRIWMMS